MQFILSCIFQYPKGDVIMNELTLEKFMELIRTYNKEEEEIIKKAYDFAEMLHAGQTRQSGEPYIIHPLNVAYTLAEMKADRDTVIAGLLHDTLEDTPVTKEELSEMFNPTVAELVDGVTKISKMNFSSKEEMKATNTRKLITAMTNDIRVVIVKLADRLHNMQTLQFKSEFKQKENAIETMEIFVPLAYYIGAYRIKSNLEDLSLQYLEPYSYKKIEEKMQKYQDDAMVKEMLHQIKTVLNDNNIPNEIKARTKNIYGIYKRLNEGEKIDTIHDLYALKVMVDEVYQCYMALGYVHSKYNPLNHKFKDFICNPKTNMYQSLHTTIFGPNDKLVQTQIRTHEMDAIASFGLTAYWASEKGKAAKIMNNKMHNTSQFYNDLIVMNKMFTDNQEFVKNMKLELFGDKIYVYNTKGEVIELPLNSTILDYLAKFNYNQDNSIVFINDYQTEGTQVLKNKDRIKIITK